jgi:2,4-dienoyl-CoA reductase-like NADH-dependent reductase (Old Yellow Enzyme family)
MTASFHRRPQFVTNHLRIIDYPQIFDVFKETASVSILFSPIELGQQTFSNRVVVAPMCQYSADNGNATDWHVMHLGNLSMSGAAILIIEATAIEPIGRITPGCLGLWSDENEAALARVLSAVKPVSTAKIFIQLAHAGRKGSSARPWEGGQQISDIQGGWPTVGPSAVAHNSHESPPEALDQAGLERIKQGFVQAAKRAVRLGIDGIELHAAHGYLLHQFLSPIANKRQDQYGGSLENRMRFALEIFEAIQAAIPKSTVLGVRISATDWMDEGWTLEQSIEFAHVLKDRGCHFIDVSSGGVSSAQKIKLEPGYQVPHAEAIKQATGLPTMAVGLITEPSQAEAILAHNQADMIALARGMLYDPRWGWHAAAALGDGIEAPKQFWRCQPREFSNLFKNTQLGQR